MNGIGINIKQVVIKHYQISFFTCFYGSYFIGEPLSSIFGLRSENLMTDMKEY